MRLFRMSLLALLAHRIHAQQKAPFRIINAVSGLCLRYRTDPQPYTGTNNWISVYSCSAEGTNPYEYWYLSCPTCDDTQGTNIQSVVNGENLGCGSGLQSDIGSETLGHCYLTSGYSTACQTNFAFVPVTQNNFNIFSTCFGRSTCIDGYDTSKNYMAYLNVWC